MAVVSYIYDHHQRDLGRRLMQAQHDHHALGVATLHTHLDHDNCLEVVLLRGAAEAVRGFAQALVSERGVRLGGMNLLPLPAAAPHDHGAAHPDAAVPRRRRAPGVTRRGCGRQATSSFVAARSVLS
jgi:CopG family nickel-responsive transcriptional regulator